MRLSRTSISAKRARAWAPVDKDRDQSPLLHHLSFHVDEPTLDFAQLEVEPARSAAALQDLDVMIAVCGASDTIEVD